MISNDTLNEEKIRRIIQEELVNFVGINKTVFKNNIQILNARNIQLGRTNGTKIGTEGGATGQKLGFWDTTPVVQPTAITDPSNAGETYAQAQVQTIVDKVKAILDALQATGLIDT